MAAEAVARDPSPTVRSVERCLEVGGVKESWLVARRRERVARWERTAAFPCEALSLMMPMRSLSLVILIEFETQAYTLRDKTVKDSKLWLLNFFKANNCVLLVLVIDYLTSMIKKLVTQQQKSNDGLILHSISNFIDYYFIIESICQVNIDKNE